MSGPHAEIAADAPPPRPSERDGLLATPAASTLLAEAPAELIELNEQFFIIEEGGKHFVATEWHDTVRNRRAIKRYTFEEFRKRYLGQQVRIGRRDLPLAKAWLEWSDRRQYLGGVVFDPSPRIPPPDVFNLWRGWPIAPLRGDWSILRDHIHDVVCAGDDDLFKYFVSWMARLVQYPNRPGEVVPVLRGRQGAGKSVAGNALRRLFGQHAMAVSSPRAVTGQFNAHLRDLVFLLANEAFFAGDRASVSTLKALITDETLFIEQKGVDAIEVPNMLHVLMTTNSEWAVPVALDDRRFFVLDVSSHRVGDRTYFRELHEAIESDCVIAAMLHDLLSQPLDGFEVRDIPATTARYEQMIHSLETEQGWLFHILALGSLGSDIGDWQPWVSTRMLQESHETWAKNGRFRQVTDPATLGKFLGRFFTPKRPRMGNSERERGYQFGSLAEARARFCEVMKLPPDTFPADDDASASEEPTT